MIDRWIVDSEPSARYPIYTRGNVGEVFPDPVAPLSADFITMGAEPGWRDAFERFGAFDANEFDPANNEIIGIFGGYCYLNVSISRILGVRTPGLTAESIDYQLWGEMPGVPPYAAQPTDESAEHGERITRTLGWILSTESFDELLEDEKMLDGLRDNRPDLTKLTEAQLVDRARDLFRAHFRYLFAQHLFTTYCSTVPVGIIQQVCEAVGRPSDMLKLLAGVGDVESAAPSYAMWNLSRLDPDSEKFKIGFNEFLREYGARGPNEWETRSPTWETEPELALVAIDQMRRSPDSASPIDHQAVRSAERERVGAEIVAMLDGDPETQGQFQAALRAAPIFLAGRERSKTNAIRLTHELRLAFVELGRRYVERGHFDNVNSYGMLRWDELDAVVEDPASLTAALRQREHDYAELNEVEPPFVFDGTPPPISTWARRGGRPVSVANAGDELHGMSGCPGIARGRARVVLDSHDPTALEPGDVLVAPITDPSWTPLFVPAAAVIVDVGAPLSHAIIVSRELGIPCVVSVTDATRRIPDGAVVEVNGDTGTVTVVST
ncbi:MAG TPA: PEP-utilizing enzyme [Acidimicrobiales bacterium]|nr:PEP-utilizing enzyme [Acidimicrobiales bacterium]